MVQCSANGCSNQTVDRTKSYLKDSGIIVSTNQTGGKFKDINKSANRSFHE